MASSQTGSSASYLCWTLDVGRSALATPKLSAYAGSTFFFRHGRVAESGLRHSTRNRAWGNPPWVRIPPLPFCVALRAYFRSNSPLRRIQSGNEIAVASDAFNGTLLTSLSLLYEYALSLPFFFDRDRPYLSDNCFGTKLAEHDAATAFSDHE